MWSLSAVDIFLLMFQVKIFMHTQLRVGFQAEWWSACNRDLPAQSRSLAEARK